MPQTLTAILLFGAVVLAVLAMQAGASRLCDMLGGLRQRLGLSSIAAGALLGLGTASPEIAVNVSSAVFGWPDLGVGAALGSNVPAIPLMMVVAYLSTRWHRDMPSREIPTPDPAHHEERPREPEIAPRALPAGVLPYVLTLFVLLTVSLTPGLEGMQPLDAVPLLACFAFFLWRSVAPDVDGPGPVTQALDTRRTLSGLALIVAGAVGGVIATNRLDVILGIPDIVGGIFIIGLLCALPESFAAWTMARQGRATMAMSGVMSDGITSLSVALVPVALTNGALGDPWLLVLNVGFILVSLGVYAFGNHPRYGRRLTPVLVAGITVLYAAYLGLAYILIFGA